MKKSPDTTKELGLAASVDYTTPRFFRAENHNQTNGFHLMSLAELREMVDNPRTGAKNTAPVFAPHNGEAKTKEAAIKAQFSALILDFDDGNIQPKDICKPLEGVPLLVWTSSSSTAANRKWKVVIPLSRPISAEQYVPLALGAALHLGTDQAQARVSQICYTPNKLSEDSEYMSAHSVDDPTQFIDPESSPFAKQCLDAFEADQAANEAKAKAAPIKPRTRDSSQSGGVFQMANDAYTVRSILEGAGYEKLGKKYLSPNSRSGFAGVNVITGDDGIERAYSHHSRDSDPLADGHAHDAFDLLLILRFDGDMRKAVKELSAELDPEGQKQRQREYKQSLEGNVQAFEMERSKTVLARLNEDSQPFDLRKFTLKGQADDMKQKMQDEVFILGRIALLGQLTVIYAKPNTGKTLITLRLLIDSVVDGTLKGDDVFYINADDTYRGLVSKLELAERYGFHMLAPNENGFQPKEFAHHLASMIEIDTARGKVIILDTMKKFTDLMDKKVASDFMTMLRQFVQAGGSIVALAHTNKNRSAEGKVIAGGTSDVVDDADCVYTLDETALDPRFKTVLFEKLKSRGDVADTAAYRYSIESGNSYDKLIASVTRLGEAEVSQAKVSIALAAEQARDKEAIEAITQCIGNGTTGKADMLREAAGFSGMSKPRIQRVLRRYTGTLWHVAVGERNTQIYTIVEAAEAMLPEDIF